MGPALRTGRNLDSLDIAKRSVRGSLVLFAGNFVATGTAAVAIILIARLLGPTDYGTYTLVLVVPGFISSFLGFGVNTAVIRFSAYYSSLGRPDDARRITINAVRFLWLSGAALTVAAYFLAGPLAPLLLQRPGLVPYVQLACFTVLGSTVFSTATSAAVGWNQMGLSALTTVAQALTKLVFAPLLILLGWGITGALVGHMLSFLVAGGVGTAVLYATRLRGPPARGSFLADLRDLLRFGLPLYGGSVVTSTAVYFVTIILAFIASDAVFGYYQAAYNLVAPITLVSSALVNSLFPAFASLDGVGGDVKVAFREAYRFVAFLLTPLILFMSSAARLLVVTLYGPSFSGSVHYLQILSLAYLPIAFGYAVHPAFFNGFGRPRLTTALLLAGAATLVVSAPLLALVLHLGVEGLVLATFLSYMAAWGAGTYLADRFMGARLDFRANAGILLASIASAAAVFLTPELPFSNVLALAADIVMFALLYLTLAPLLGAVKVYDLETMKSTFAGMGPVSAAFDWLVRYEEFILSLKRRGVRGSQGSAA